MLLVIDDSGSMSEEQKKLSAVLDSLVRVLSSGRHSGDLKAVGPTDFPPVESLHIGVVSTDMGVNGAPAQKSCGALSFAPDERDTATTFTFLNKPRGDDGILSTSTAVAVAGIWAPAAQGEAPVELVPADPACSAAPFPPGRPYIDYRAGDDALEAAKVFRCIAKLGRNGCGLEQPLEAALKALTPSDSRLRFTESSVGHGDGPNEGFLREDAILAVVFVSDEDDSSIPDSSNFLFDATSTQAAGEINVRSLLPENQKYLHPVKRYVDGLRALKPAAYQDRIVIASAVGLPVSKTTGEQVHQGTEAIETLLDRPDMQPMVRRNMWGTADEPAPTCVSDQGDGSAAPGRRYLQLSREFGDNGFVTSICENHYGPLLQAVASRIGTLLGGDD